MSNTCKTNGAIHYRYWLLICILIIIAIATDRWTGQQGFTDYLSNAATMTSLLLGLVAIIYSFYSNNAISSNLGSITTVSKDVQHVSEQITQYISLAKDIESAGRKNVSAMSDISQEMNDGLGKFANLLNVMNEKNNAMHGMLSELPSKLDSLENKLTETTQKQKLLDNRPTEPLISENGVKRFFLRSSLMESLIAYCCLASWKTTKIIDPSRISSLVGLEGKTEETEFFIRCLDSLGLIQIHSPEGDDSIYIISKINRHFRTNAKELLLNQIKADCESEDEVAFWTKVVSIIEKHYNVSTQTSEGS